MIKEENKNFKLHLLYGNKTEKDILLKKELDAIS